MPKVEVVFYRDDKGECPVLNCLDRWTEKVQDKFLIRIERLSELGHELRRPEADTLRDGIHELRAKHGSVNYRILYFFGERLDKSKVAVLFDGLTKEDIVPPKDIDRAVDGKKKFAANPKKHTHEQDDDED